MRGQWQYHRLAESADGEPAGSPWRPSTPPTSPDIGVIAQLLLDQEPATDTLLAQSDGTIWRLSWSRDVISVSPQEPDARVTPYAEAEPQDLADLITWIARGVGADRPLLTPGAWRALHAEHWLSEVIREHHHLTDACLLVDGPGEIRGWTTHAGVTLIDLRWDEPDNALGWRLLQWLDNRDLGWQAVRAVAPARHFLHRLALGDVGDASALMDGLDELATQTTSLPLGLLMRLATALDDADIAHGLRHGESHVLSPQQAAEARIELTTDGLVWHHPAAQDLAEVELVRLVFGAESKVVPGPLKAECLAALRHTVSAANKALWWWQRGADVTPDRLAGSASLTDALVWSEQAVASGDDGAIAASWLDGMLKLAATEVAVRDEVSHDDAARICAIVGQSGADGAIALQALSLAATARREALLDTVGLSLTGCTAQPLVLIDGVDPRLQEIRHG